MTFRHIELVAEINKNTIKTMKNHEKLVLQLKYFKRYMLDIHVMFSAFGTELLRTIIGNHSASTFLLEIFLHSGVILEIEGSIH